MIIYVETDKDNHVINWGSSRTTEDDIEIEVENNHPIFFFSPKLFTVKDGQLFKDESLTLERAKTKKLKELNEACQQSILNGFTHEIDGIPYHFSFDVEAQFNFHATQTLFANGMVDEIVWTVKKDGEYERIIVTKPIMDMLTLSILQHKNGNISKFRDFLEPLVQDATTVEEVESITWDNL